MCANACDWQCVCRNHTKAQVRWPIHNNPLSQPIHPLAFLVYCCFCCLCGCCTDTAFAVFVFSFLEFCRAPLTLWMTKSAQPKLFKTCKKKYLYTHLKTTVPSCFSYKNAALELQTQKGFTVFFQFIKKLIAKKEKSLNLIIVEVLFSNLY